MLSADDMQKILNQIRDEERARVAGQKREQRDKRLQNQKDQAEKDNQIKTKDGTITIFEQVIHDANNAINADFRSVNNWASCMGELLNMYVMLNKAVDVALRKKWLNSKAKLYGREIGYALADKACELTDKAISFFTGNPEVDMPQLYHFVSMNEENELVIEPLVRSDNGAPISLLDNLFKQGMNIWLGECHYKPDPDHPNKYVHEHDGTVLTQEKFQDLKDDSLNSFLTREFPQVSFSPR